MRIYMCTYIHMQMSCACAAHYRSMHVHTMCVCACVFTYMQSPLGAVSTLCKYDTALHVSKRFWVRTGHVEYCVRKRRPTAVVNGW